MADRSAFDDALRRYCFETTRIIHEFSIGWYGKHAFGEDGPSPRAITGYGGFALDEDPVGVAPQGTGVWVESA